MGMSNYVHLGDVTILCETDKAFEVEYEGECIWIPKSQIADPDTYSPGDCVTLSITEWIAEQKGISV